MFKSKRANWYELSSIRAGLGRINYITPTSESVLKQDVQRLVALKRSIRPVARGTNLIGSDRIHHHHVLLSTNGLEQAECQGDGRFKVQPGISMLRFIHFAAGKQFGGLAALCGIPGSIGGALAMNAGANDCSISDYVEEMQGINLANGMPWQWRQGDGGWGYRHSPIPKNVCVYSAVLQLKPSTEAQEKEAIQTELARRGLVTPKGRSCGSVFTNPEGTTAGKLLDEAGCKGMHEGPFSVSEEHANWIVNLKGVPGKAEDCKRLLTRMQDMVLMKYGITLQPEWRFADNW